MDASFTLISLNSFNAVFVGSIGFFKFLEMEEHISKILSVKVDIVTKNALKPRIGEHILKEVIAI